MVKNMVFDVGGVLLHYCPEDFLKKMVENTEARQAVLENVFMSPEWHLADAGKATDTELTDAAIRRSPQYESEIRHAVSIWHTGLRRVDGMTHLVRRLHEKKVPLYVISNFSQRFHELTGYEDLFGMMKGILISSDIQMVKPHPDIYAYFLSHYGLEADECLFIDDMAANVEGARKAGLQAHQFIDAAELTAFLETENIL